MIRTKGEAGTGDIVEAVRHVRTLHKEIKVLQTMDDDELFTYAKEIGAPLDLLQQTKKDGRLPVVNFAAGGVATPADAALCMQLGVDGVFVGSGIFKSEDPEARAVAIVQAVTHFRDAKKLAEVSTGIGAPMTGIGMGDGTNFAAREGGNMPPLTASTGYASSTYASKSSGYAKAAEPRSKHADWSPTLGPEFPVKA